ncbi:ATP-dependent Clp protease ATP-binding subunit [Aerococcus tenax]|uniref:ATP-dependent Clp protease ATP-binding subunit n=1 Tax=Aerococcus tenax TaxID=3078812 RepID=UPI0018A6D546|nr:ATP-dependent Clp protease ATP-binding subunit [Aerococcus tenax]
MKCQRCNQREAAIHMYANINGQRQAINLCQPCYAEIIRNQSQSGKSNNDNNSWGNLYELLRQMQDKGPHNANGQEPPHHPNDGQGNSLLANYGTNMTELARQGKYDPVIGRDQEINRVIEILNRRTKNNPVLIGEAGVGKTAVVEGLAQKIVAKEVPEKLQNKEVISLDVASLVQGTGVRGQFEEKMQALIKEVSSNQSIILFIDEIHEIVGAGTADNSSMDAGNILKPALARGEMQLVGATTLNEFRRIEKDGALARRLQPVQVDEPSVEEAITIIKGLADQYQKFHHVHFTDQALEATVTLSNRYIQDRQLPDKAIDLLDEAGSKKNLTIPFLDKEALEDQIQELEKLKEMATDAEDYEKAAYYRDQLKKYKDMAANNEAVVEQVPTITVEDIEELVEAKTGIPVGQLQDQEQSNLLQLEDELKETIIGQDPAVEKVSAAIRRNRVGFHPGNKPIASFLFVGPTGVGKTELARQLAKQLFGSEEAMIRFDMSEYMEKHSVSKMIGSPPGYVGYDEAGQLTEQVRRQPYSLILLDEVEKAHPDVLNLFLQIMEDGRLTDAQGRTVSFKDTLIIMTSNAGTGNVEASVGFAASQQGKNQSVLDQLDNYFKPEFMNRFDGIIEFQPLTKEELIQIVDHMLTSMNNQLKGQEITIAIDDQVKEAIVELGYDPKLGARPLRRVIQEQIENQVADLYLKDPSVSYVHFTVDDSGNIVVNESENSQALEETEVD